MKTFITFMAGILLAAGAFMIYENQKDDEEILSHDYDMNLEEASEEVTEVIREYNKNDDTIFDYYPSDSSTFEFADSDMPMNITLQTSGFMPNFEDLEANAKECGVENSSEYYNNLADTFYDAYQSTYIFKYNDLSQEEDTYVITVIDNVAGYSTMQEFKKDFDLCYAGGSLYPFDINEEFLLFVSSCVSGYDDGSENPNGCQVMKEFIESSLYLK